MENVPLDFETLTFSFKTPVTGSKYGTTFRGKRHSFKPLLKIKTPHDGHCPTFLRVVVGMTFWLGD
jgi:hypothetical protein